MAGIISGLIWSAILFVIVVVQNPLQYPIFAQDASTELAIVLGFSGVLWGVFFGILYNWLPGETSLVKGAAWGVVFWLIIIPISGYIVETFGSHIANLSRIALATDLTLLVGAAISGILLELILMRISKSGKR